MGNHLLDPGYGHGCLAAQVDCRVVRHEEPHIVSPVVQVTTECAGHVSKPAGLCEWCDFRSYKTDLSRHEREV